MPDTDTPSAEALADQLTEDALLTGLSRREHLDYRIDAAAALRSLASERDALHTRVSDYETQLTAIMPPDFKDWHETHKSEWPWVAANLIVSQRAEIEMDATTMDAMSARLAEVEAERDALRAALDAERERCALLAEEYATWGGSNFHAWFTKLAADIRATPPQQEPTA